MNYQTIIVDDDDLSVKVLEKMVNATSHLTHAGSAKSAIEATSLLANNQVDIVLLDIEMPEMSGLQFINTLRQRPEIILVTSQRDYAIDAFEYEVTDYLLKPVPFQRFMKAINRASENLQKATAKPVQEEEKPSTTIFIKERNQFTRLDKSQIQYVEAYGDYVHIQTANQQHTIHSTMKAMQQKLEDGEFMRVHRSYIVNTRLIESFDENLLFIRNQVIPVGGNYKQRLMKRLGLS